VDCVKALLWRDAEGAMAPRYAARKYRFPLIRPAVPEPESWLPFLRDSYEHQWFSNFGPAVHRLETEFGQAFGESDDVFVLTSSATSGLAACLIAAGVTGPVLVPAFTFPATFAAVRMAGAEPLLVDVDPITWSCDPNALQQGLKQTGARAAVLVAPFGITQNFTAHVAQCEAAEAETIIDNAGGLGGGPRGRRALRGNAMEVYSLHATKPFAAGEGGAIQAGRDWAARLRSAINFGLPWQPGGTPSWGINGKMPEVTAAIGLATLAGYAEALRTRQMQAARYCELIGRFNRVVIHRGIADAPWQVFPCLLPNPQAASDFVDAAARQGLEVRRYYQPSLADWGGLRALDDCPTARDLASRMVCLPVYPATSDGEIECLHEVVAAALAEALRTG
jgi:dTDP-4-amino-4,6-dideoxygalactose transaminase